MFGFVSTPTRAPSAVSRLDVALASLSSALDEVRAAAASAPADVAITASLRGADLLIATGLSLLGQGGFGARVGMEPVSMLQLYARRTYSDARMLVETSSALHAMPATSARLSSGTLSYSEVRGIVCAARSVDAPGRAALDLLVATTPDSLGPDDLLDRVGALVAARRPDLQRGREDRAVSRGFLAIQGRLDGSSSFYGEADALSTATLVEAIDTRADLPVSADDPDAPSRAHQRLEALIGICEDSLAGGPTGTRPRPRFLVSLDLDAYAAGDTGAARLLWDLAGPAPRISPLSTEMLLCDADVVPVLFRAGRPVGVGDAKGNIPKKLRTALIARDGRCRFPTCRAPASFTDAHHIVPPGRGGPTDEANCLLLCRTHHRAVHRYGWKISIRARGVVGWRYRGRSFTSQPAMRARE